MKKILVVIAMAFVMSLPWNTATAAPVVPANVVTVDPGDTVEDPRTDDPLARQAAGSSWDCYRISRTARDVYAWDWWGSKILDWRAKLIVTKCETVYEHYYILREMKYSMEHLTESRNCPYVDTYRLNPFPIGGVNPPTKDWNCNSGQDKYTWSFDMGDEPLYNNEGDRCFSLDWRITISPIHDDISDPSPSTKCLD